MTLFTYNRHELLQAYACGRFPTLNSAGKFFLYAPQQRALLPVSGMHVSKTLKQTLRKDHFHISYDRCFDKVMEECVRSQDNWITPELRWVYSAIHKDGWAHSVEVWRDDRLVGGLYGMAIGAVFFIESMFSSESDASKVATWYLIEELREQGFKIVDVQLMSPHLKSLGAFELTRNEFELQLRVATEVTTKWGQDRSRLEAGLDSVVLASDRLQIRRLNGTDAEKLYQMQLSEDFSRYTLVEPHRDVEQTATWLSDSVIPQYRKGALDPLGIVLRETEELIGTVGCFIPSRHLPQMELAYDLQTKHWGHGYATEACRLLIDHAFATSPIHRLQSRVATENKRSEKVLHRLGFTFEGILRQSMFFDSKTWDMNYYSLLRDEWSATRDRNEKNRDADGIWTTATPVPQSNESY